jgi:hypothetical protein
MPYAIRKLPNQNQYKVYNRLTKQVHSHHTSKVNAIKQVRLLKQKEGFGELSSLISFGNKLVYGRKTLSPKCMKILQEMGDGIITSLVVVRKPIGHLYEKFIRTFSEVPFDKLFHLGLIVKTTKGDVMIEKNAVINFIQNPRQDGETFTISRVPANLTFQTLIDNTEKAMGDKFLPYNGFNNNCQNFIINVLKANGITEGEEFVSQKVGGILKDSPYIKKLINFATELGGRYDVIKQGGNPLLEKVEQKGVSNGLYSNDIQKILKHNGHPIIGVFSKDKLPKELKDGWYVINLQSTNQGNKKGTHWTAFKVDGDHLSYFDAFGFSPPIEVLQRATGDILYSNREIQDIHSTCCGWFCIGAIVSDNGIGDPVSHFNRYLNRFSDNTFVNDRILSDYLTSKIHL